MALADDLTAEVRKIFTDKWEVRSGRVVPDPEDLALGNAAVEFERATILYADLHGSTAMVNSKKWEFSGEIYKTYLHCASKIIRSVEGAITSYDGDRVMGVFVGDLQCTNAVKCALRITHAVSTIINPEMRRKWHVPGIDTSPIRAARTGVRGDNDIVWIGRAANYAAKLTELDGATTWITKEVYERLADNQGGTPKTTMFNPRTWTQQGNHAIYSTTYTWAL